VLSKPVPLLEGRRPRTGHPQFKKATCQSGTHLQTPHLVLDDLDDLTPAAAPGLPVYSSVQITWLPRIFGRQAGSMGPRSLLETPY
jgi:hypothetical protein